jgi:hypothetical protein
VCHCGFLCGVYHRRALCRMYHRRPLCRMYHSSANQSLVEYGIIIAYHHRIGSEDCSSCEGVIGEGRLGVLGREPIFANSIIRLHSPLKSKLNRATNKPYLINLSSCK